MKRNTRKLFILLFLVIIFSCSTAPPSKTVFLRDYKHRIVKVVPVKNGKTITIKVHHKGVLSSAERNDLVRWYKSKHHRPHNRIKVVFIRI